MPARPKYETQPKIDLALLERHGLFGRSDPLGYESAGMQMLVMLKWHGRSEYSVLVFFEWEEMLWMQSIEIGSMRRKTGPARHFICPMEGTRCNELHFHAGQFVSRRVNPALSPKKPPAVHRREVALMRMRDRLLGTDGHPPATGVERQKLVIKLQAIPFTQLRWPELGPIFEREDKIRQRTRRHNAKLARRAMLQSTGWAVAEGIMDRREVDLTEYLAKTPAEWLSQLPECEDRFGAAPLQFIEARPALDLRLLARRWKFDEMAVWSQVMIWSSLGAILIADFRDPEQPFLALCNVQKPNGDKLPDQIIRLVPSAFKSRWFMQCPLSHRRCDILYFREDIFASAKAARLIHRSQRADAA